MLRLALALLLVLHASDLFAASDADADPKFPTRVYSADLDTRKQDLARRIFPTALGFAFFTQSTSSNAAGNALTGRRISNTNTAQAAMVVRDGFLSNIAGIDEGAGRFLVVGNSPTNADGGVDGGVFRLTANLDFDTTFAGDGGITLNIGGVDLEEPLAVALDGATLNGFVAVYGTNPGTVNGALYLAKIAPSGTVDYYTKLIPANARRNATMLLDRQGRLLVAAQEGFDATCRTRMSRYLIPATGLPTLDTSFAPATGNVAYVDRFDTCEVVERIVERRDGRLLVLAWTSSVLGQRSSTLVQFLADGGVDLSFNAFNSDYQGRALALQSDNRIIVAGSHGADAFVERRRNNGLLDPDFSVTGAETRMRFIQDGVLSASSVADIVIVNDRIIALGEALLHDTAMDYNPVVFAMLGTDRFFANSFE